MENEDTKKPDNILQHQRTATLPIMHNGSKIPFRFTFSRADVANIFDDISKMGEMDVSRKWTLDRVDPSQRAEYLSMINSPENMSLEQEVFKKLVPFLKKNSSSLGELTIES